MAVHQVSVSDGPLLGHESEGRQEVVVTVRQRVPPLIERLPLLLLLLLSLNYHVAGVLLDENLALLFPAPTPSSLPLTDINEEHDAAADEDEDNTDVDACLGPKMSVNEGVYDHTE